MNRHLFFVTVLYALFIIYGSLVPLEFRPLPSEIALNKFKYIPFLLLGAGSRADWIANILLYIPLAFFAAATFSGVQSTFLRTLAKVGVFVFGISLAVAVEFTQLFFPPRTVSLNDLLAETLGTLIGLFGWHFFGDYFSTLYRNLLRGSFASTKAAIIFYSLIYVALSLFPFDFVTSFAELEHKWADSNDALLFPLDSCRAAPFRCAIKLLVEVAVLIPLGALFCLLPYVRKHLTVAVLVGFFIGLLIETVQVFLLSGSGQGISVLTRMLGMSLGVSIWRGIKKRALPEILLLARRVLACVLLPYIAIVLMINGWFSGGWLDTPSALQKLSETHFLPLYYYYYTSEGVALVSLLSNVGMYFPVGVGLWAQFYCTDPYGEKKPPHWFYIGLIAALFALVVETGKLFLPNKHADPSDIWLAFSAAACCYEGLNRFRDWLKYGPRPATPATAATPAIPAAAPPAEQIHQDLTPATVNKKWRILSVIIWGLIIAGLANYPVAPIALGLGLVGYSVLLKYFPYAWLIAIPALLPIMDFTLWTGHFFFDEFDLLILATLACYFWQKPVTRTRSLLSPLTNLLLLGFIGFYCISLVRGLLPLTPPDANAFSNYYSHYNSLRLGKGFIWSILLLPYLQLTLRRYRYASDYFAGGVLLGLAGVSVFALIERWVFTGLLDFTSDYRINALFSTMHAGGGHIESYLMLSLPFITLLFVRPNHRLFFTSIGIGLFTLGLYTLLVTFSRGGYIGFVVAFAVLLLALLVGFRKNLALSQQSMLVLPLLAIALLMAVPVLSGSMIQHRFAIIDKDSDSRYFHWRDALAMRDPDMLTQLFGMGLGSYPRTFFWLNNENAHPATYEIDVENDNAFLSLKGGDALFVGQSLNLQAHTDYRLLMDVRSATEGLILSTAICEKSVQYSLRCSSVKNAIANQEWTPTEQTINTGEVGGQLPGVFIKRPIQLTFYNGSGRGKLINIDNVQLLDANGNNVLANGDFSKGTDFWFFSAEKHNPWHIFNFWVHLLFDLGWLGASAFLLFFIKVLYSLCRRLPRQPLQASVILSALAGFMVVGFVDSPFDAPRLTLLFFLLLYFALMRTPSAWLQKPKPPITGQ